jgi:hypothetical protein
MNKGMSPLIGGIFLVLATIGISILVAQWFDDFSTSEKNFLINKTRTQLACDNVGIYIRNITFECASGCFTGVPYKINATVENIGSEVVLLSELFISLSDGLSYSIYGNITSLAPGSSGVKDFNSILARNISTSLIFNISHPSIKSVSVYDEYDIQIFNANVSGNYYDSSLVYSSSFFKIEAVDASGNVIRKYHPFKKGGECTTASAIDLIRLSALNCPNVQDVYPPEDVFIVNCG